MSELTHESGSLWRIKNEYASDMNHCEKCRKLWEKLEKQKEQNVKELMALLKDHI
jgi:beta-galactosidase GanA